MDLNNTTLHNIKSWQKTQDNGLILYEKFPDQNLATDIRKEPLDFKKFANYHGNVLDVGSGLEIPSYLKNVENAFFVGIDPFVTKQSSVDKIILMKAIGENLPFLSKSFDCVSFATSFDHVIEPEIVLAEVKRILKDDGKAIFWVEKEPDKRKLLSRIKSKIPSFIKNSVKSDTTSEQRNIIESLEKPKDAIDQFHLRHIRENDFVKLANSAGFEKISEERHVEYHSVFFMFEKKSY